MSFEAVQPGQRAATPGASGLQSKLGGAPDWIQDEEWPICRSCRDRMTFVAQIDSIEHDTEQNPHRVDCLSGKQDFVFGDVGMIYVFLCFKCLESRSVLQTP